MKVKIMQRSVYHKYAEVEIEVPEIYDYKNMQDYLINNEDLYIDKVDKELDEVEYDFGSGVGVYEGLDEAVSDSEWRFEIVGKQYGGHL